MIILKVLFCHVQKILLIYTNDPQYAVHCEFTLLISSKLLIMFCVKKLIDLT